MKNILFIRLRLLGDIILTIPTIRIFHKNFPQTRIVYLVEEKFKEIAEMIPHIDRVMCVPRKMGIIKHYLFRQEMKKEKFDAVVDLHSGPKGALLTRLSNAKIRIGYNSLNRDWAYTHLTARKFQKSSQHSTLNQARHLEHLGINVENILPYPRLNLEKFRISDFISDIINKHNSQKKVTIHVGAGNKFRDWGNDNFSNLIKLLLSSEFTVFLIGWGDQEMERRKVLENHHSVKNLIGKLTIPETCLLISRSDVYFGVDSGPLHLASLTQTPIVAIYGPNLPEISGPWREEQTTIIQLPLNCRPCSQRRCIYDSIRCVQDISPPEIYQAITAYLH